MYTVTGSFKDGVAKPSEPVKGHEGQPVLITFLPDDSDIADAEAIDDEFPTLEEVVDRIKALGVAQEGYTPPTESLSTALASAADEPPIDPAEWERQWTIVEADMKQRDLDDDRAEGRL